MSAGERQMGPISGGPIDLASARLRRASLRFATLSGGNFAGADLSEADFSDSRLDGANLTAANLSEALLERADFQGTDLTHANLSGANLLEARNLTQDQIESAAGDLFTLLPQHLTRPQSWTGAVADVQPASQGRYAGYRPDVKKGPAPASVSETFSWLVGGPGSARRSDAPQGDPQGA